MDSASLKGMTIVSIAEGSRLGRVDDLWLDTAQRCISALHASDQGRRFIIPFQFVRNIGKDAITVESSEVTQADGQNSQAAGVLRLGEFLKLKAVDESGTLIGTISRADFNPTSGQLVGLDVHKGGVLGLGGTTTTIAVEQIRMIGPELVTVTSVEAQP